MHRLQSRRSHHHRSCIITMQHSTPPKQKVLLFCVYFPESKFLLYESASRSINPLSRTRSMDPLEAPEIWFHPTILHFSCCSVLCFIIDMAASTHKCLHNDTETPVGREEEKTRKGGKSLDCSDDCHSTYGFINSKKFQKRRKTTPQVPVHHLG